MRNDSAQELIAELNGQNCPIESKRGRTGGTYAVKELVYAYAMWISPVYHLKVIRAYDRMVTDGVAVHVMRDIRNMLEDLGGEDASSFAGIYLDAYKREKPCFNLPRDLTETLITGYSTAMRAKVIDRGRELEVEVVKPTLQGDDLTMTSQEIADMVSSQHSNLKVSIERLIDRGVIQAVALQDLRSDSGQLSKVYVFSGPQGKRGSIIVVAQLCPEFTAALVDRWQELKAEKGKPAFAPEDQYREVD